MSMRDRVVIIPRITLRTRALPLTFVACLLCLAACSSARDDATTEYSSVVEVDGSKDFATQRSLAAGAYLVEVRERDIDLRTLVDAAGRHCELEDQVQRHGVQYQVVSLVAPGPLRIALRSADHRTKQGSAGIRVLRFTRAATAPADARERGFVAFGVAGEQTALATGNANADAAGDAYALAAEKLHEAVTQFESAGDAPALAQAQYTLAWLQYVARNDHAAAIRAAEAASKAFDDADDEAGVEGAAVVRSAAELELAAGMNASTQRAEQSAMYDTADRRLAAAADFFSHHARPVQAAYAVNQRGLRALNVGDYESAATYFARAAEMSAANDDVGERTRSLANLAWVHNRQGYVAQAAAEYASMLPLIERERQPYQYATMLGNYGFCLIALGDFDRALALHTDALELYTRLGNEADRATELAALGGLYYRIGDNERALDTLRAAIAAHEKVGNGIGHASTLRVAGNAASALGRHEQALDFLRQSMRIDANKNSIARTHTLVAAELRTLGKLPEAEVEIAQALAASNALVHANGIEERGRLRLAQGKVDSGITDLRAADREYVAMGLEFNRIDTNTGLSQALLAKRDVAGAAAAADEAISIVSRTRVKSANPEWRARFLSARYSPYEARIAADLAGPEGAASKGAWRAFRTAEAVRARSLADEIVFDARHEVATSDPALEVLRAKLTSLQMRLETRMQRQDQDDAGTIDLRRSIAETRALLESRRAGVAANEFALPPALEQVQSQLPPDTAVIAYFVGDDSAHAWLLTRNSLRHANLPARPRLQASIEASLTELREIAGPRTATRALGATLLDGLLDGIAEHRLLVIADGPLNGVPFAALPAPGGDAMLIDRYIIGYAPSLTLAMQSPARPHSRAHRVAVISDPVYASDDRRLQLAGGTSGNLRGGRPASLFNLTRLPYSALEARAVVGAFGAAETIQLSGFEATPQRVLALPHEDLAVLHFATHAVARRDSPEQSALYLSEFTPAGAMLEDSRITTSDIKRSGLRADVVVLSGCATGDGSELRGEGVLGLTYGFLANGSRAVVATLWPVEDASTARFMSEFYGAYRTAHRSPEALRAAQLRTRGVVAPAVWASFVVRANEFP
jgi:CHAT domain-containing protein/tetratricopeptide (TPR) repeat protein